MFVESTLQHIEYLSVQMPANSPAAPEDGQNISRSANHIYVNCAKYLSNLYSNCEFHFVVSRVSFVVIFYCCLLPSIRVHAGGAGGGSLDDDGDRDQATLQFHANLDISTNATTLAANKPTLTATTSTTGSSTRTGAIVEALNGHDLSTSSPRRQQQQQQRPLKDILAKVRPKSYFYE